MALFLAQGRARRALDYHPVKCLLRIRRKLWGRGFAGRSGGPGISVLEDQEDWEQASSDWLNRVSSEMRDTPAVLRTPAFLSAWSGGVSVSSSPAPIPQPLLGLPSLATSAGGTQGWAPATNWVSQSFAGVSYLFWVASGLTPGYGFLLFKKNLLFG